MVLRGNVHDDLLDMDSPRWPVCAVLHRHLLKRVEHVLAADELAKDGVLMIEVLRSAKREVPLGARVARVSTSRRVARSPGGLTHSYPSRG